MGIVLLLMGVGMLVDRGVGNATFTAIAAADPITGGSPTAFAPYGPASLPEVSTNSTTTSGASAHVCS